MSLQSDFAKEYQGIETLEYPWGYVEFMVNAEGNLYLGNMYILPEERKNNRARQLLNELIVIAKKLGCPKLITATNLNSFHPEISMLVILHGGFLPYQATDNVVLFQLVI